MIIQHDTRINTNHIGKRLPVFSSKIFLASDTLKNKTDLVRMLIICIIISLTDQKHSKITLTILSYLTCRAKSNPVNVSQIIELE